MNSNHIIEWLLGIRKDNPFSNLKAPYITKVDGLEKKSYCPRCENYVRNEDYVEMAGLCRAHNVDAFNDVSPRGDY